MGFWQGINEGLSEVMAQKERQRELEARQRETEQEREFRRQEAATSMAFEREQYMLQIGETRRDILFEERLRIEKQQKEASALAGKASLFLSRFEGLEDDPAFIALASNPRLAAELQDKVIAIEESRAQNSIDGPPLGGAELLRQISIFNPETEETNFVIPSVEDIANMDMTDPTVYQTARLGMMGSPGSGMEAYLDPSVSFIPDPTVLKEGRALFDAEVLRAAEAKLKELDSNSEEWSNLRAKIDNYGDENSSARMELQDLYGVGVAAKMLDLESPYITGFKSDPLLFPYVSAASEIKVLNEIIGDPNAPADQKEEARSLLARKYGFNTGSNP